MTYLTEAAAWREIARKIVEGEWGRYGLCREINVLLLEEKTIDKEVAWTMVRRLRTYVKWHVWAYPQGMEEEGRVLAALWLWGVVGLIVGGGGNRRRRGQQG